MIKIYTSYFYQIRNMEPGCLAFSTALSDPKYFHKFGDSSIKYFDKNGVLNGLRAEPFVPRFTEELKDPCTGPKGCKHLENNLPWNCEFLEKYTELLSKLDSKDIEQRFIRVGENYLKEIGKDIPLTYILLVHEAPTNPCSERGPLQKWLKENDFGGEEWHEGKHS